MVFKRTLDTGQQRETTMHERKTVPLGSRAPPIIFASLRIAATIYHLRLAENRGLIQSSPLPCGRGSVSELVLDASDPKLPRERSRLENRLASVDACPTHKIHSTGGSACPTNSSGINPSLTLRAPHIIFASLRIAGSFNHSPLPGGRGSVSEVVGSGE